MLATAHQSRLMHCRYKNSWPHWHSPFRAPQARINSFASRQRPAGAPTPEAKSLLYANTTVRHEYQAVGPKTWSQSTTFKSVGAFFRAQPEKESAPGRFVGDGFWLVEKGFFICGFIFYIFTGCLRGAYLSSNMFYSIYNKPPFCQHPVNIIFFNWNIRLSSILIIYLFCWWMNMKCMNKRKKILIKDV